MSEFDNQLRPNGLISESSSATLGQVVRFGLAGMANVVVDLAVYAGIMGLGAPIWVAKGIAFVSGTCFAYVVNRHWTFKAGQGSPSEFRAVFVLYAFSMCINVGANSLVLILLGHDLVGKSVAYACALLLSATINFVGMKQIFAKRHVAESVKS